MHNEFDSKGMTDMKVALLTHKMMASFPAQSFIDKTVTPEMVCDEVDMIGFGCELLEITEIKPVRELCTPEKVMQSSSDFIETGESINGMLAEE